MQIASYGKVYNLGHKALVDLLREPVVVEEKIDGSQFAFGVFGGKVQCRSRRQTIHPEAPPKDFAGAVETVLGKAPSLVDGWTYRGEVVARPKHNVLCYERVPAGNVIIFDIDQGNQDYLSPGPKDEECHRLGLECVSALFEGMVASAEQVSALLDTESALGGTKIEGVVIKNYARFGVDGKALMGKFVSEAFKESHQKDWKLRQPSGGDIKQQIVAAYRTDARWEKAIAHLRDDGRLLDEPKDIGPLLKELNTDFEEECVEAIKDALWKWARKDVLRGVTAGFPEWYKARLLRMQFADEEVQCALASGIAEGVES